MAGVGGSPTKRIKTETNSNSNTLFLPKFVSAFAICEICNEKYTAKYRQLHNCKTEAKKKSKWPPPTAFYIFMNDFRETFEYENPYTNVKNSVKLGGEMWKSFTEEEKNVYRDKAAQLMEEYNKSLESSDSDDEEEEEETDDEETDDEVENKEDAPIGGQTRRGRGIWCNPGWRRRKLMMLTRSKRMKLRTKRRCTK